MRTKEEIDKKYSESEILQKINQVNHWTHRIQLGSRVITPGIVPEKIMTSKIDAIPKDLTGKTVLDIGTRDGGYAFECERRNAKEIIAIDIWQDGKVASSQEVPFKICKDILGSKAKLMELDVLDIESLHKKFDVVLFLGVYYHLMNPFLALKKIFDVCKELVILEGAVLHSEGSICYFLEPGELGGDPTNTFLWSPTFLKNYAKAIGFNKIEFLGYTEHDTAIQSHEKTSPGQDPLKRNRGIFYLWK